MHFFSTLLFLDKLFQSRLSFFSENVSKIDDSFSLLGCVFSKYCCLCIFNVFIIASASVWSSENPNPFPYFCKRLFYEMQNTEIETKKMICIRQGRQIQGRQMAYIFCMHSTFMASERTYVSSPSRSLAKYIHFVNFSSFHLTKYSAVKKSNFAEYKTSFKSPKGSLARKCRDSFLCTWVALL